MIWYFLGIFSVTFFAIAFIFLVLKDEEFSFKKDNLSTLGNHGTNGKYFNWSLIVFALTQFAFGMIVSITFPYYWNIAAILLFSIAGICLALSGYCSSSKYPRFHENVFRISAITGLGGALILTFYIFTLNSMLGLFILLGSLLIPASDIIRKKTTSGYWELVFFTGIVIWNIGFTIYLFSI